jgi:hypothetical protein
MEEQIFLTVKFFTLQEVTIKLQSNASEMPMYFNMPSNNTIDDVCAKSTATKTSSNEKV